MMLGVGWSLSDLSKKILKQGVGKGKSCSLGEGVLEMSPPLPPRKIYTPAINGSSIYMTTTQAVW